MTTITTTTSADAGTPRVPGLFDEMVSALRGVLGRGALDASARDFRLDEDEVLEQLRYGRD